MKKENIPAFEEALRIIRKNWIEGSCILAKHAKKELANANCDIFDIKQIIFDPNPVGQVEYDSEYENWKIKIKGTAIDGIELTVVLAFCEDEDMVKIITVW